MIQVSPVFPDFIETPGLKLRFIDATDAEAMFTSCMRDADVARYMGWLPHASLQATRDFIADCVAYCKAGLRLPYIIILKASDQLIGMLDVRLCGYTINIGYMLARPVWGQGLMVGAIQAFTDIALRLPGVFRVEATCDVDNYASARVLEKSGFRLEGRLARHTLHPNISSEPRDCYIYAAC
jgi:RimJ/RimL family protein N-acetyltransferase